MATVNILRWIKILDPRQVLFTGLISSYHRMVCFVSLTLDKLYNYALLQVVGRNSVPTNINFHAQTVGSQTRPTLCAVRTQPFSSDV